MGEARRLWLLPVVLAAAGAGCETPSRKGDQVMAEFTTMLPGSYDNLAQSRLPGGVHAPTKLLIAPVDAPVIGDHVYYVQEAAADDARRVFAQRLYRVVESSDPLHPMLVTYDLREPARWRDAHLRRELFRGLLPDDLRLRAGCEMHVERSDEGFRLTNDPGACRVAARGTGETLRAEQRIELDGEGIAVLDIQRDANGTVIQGGEADPWYRFVRRADAPW
jgi:hypothetical protein